jgi:hypothetical protein
LTPPVRFETMLGSDALHGDDFSSLGGMGVCSFLDMFEIDLAGGQVMLE